jgi:hypothetical protein
MNHLDIVSFAKNHFKGGIVYEYCHVSIFFIVDVKTMLVGWREKTTGLVALCVKRLLQ